jgi:hypothetical protein
MNRAWWESPICWLCDYSVFVVIIFVVLLLGLWRLKFGHIQASPVSNPIATATLAPVSITNTPWPTFTQTALPPISPTSTSTPEKPEFVIVFVPVNWRSGQSAFMAEAQHQANIFISESKIDIYFTPTVIILQEGLENVSLSDENLIFDILEFGLLVQAGDRYIGLTNGDLELGGDSGILGWTAGGQAMIAESSDPYVVAHELGHTFGLCDEYSYSDWSLQDAEVIGGCPNPYPASCPQVESDHPNCNGNPTQDGRNSIMGPAGLFGEYGFNIYCVNHLKEVFRMLSEGLVQ